MLPIAIQLYTVRDQAAADFEGTLRAIKAMGYEGVEFAGLHGKTAAEVKALCAEIGLTPISAHVPYYDMVADPKGVLSDYAEIGCEYVAIPYLTPECRPGTEGFAKVVENAELLGKVEGTRIITCHLGSGSSISAIKDGKIYDTSMGLTPLDGFMMGTRTGGFDPSAVTYIMDKEGLTPKQMDDLMNKKSGTLGISGVSSDDRDIEKAISEGNERAKLAWDMRTYQITKIIGGYIAALGGLDALVFTAGIGENQPQIRKEIIDALGYMGMKCDVEANNVRGVERLITTEDSAIPAWIIPTNEELVIARDTLALAE